jgi:hypothetical protein
MGLAAVAIIAWLIWALVASLTLRGTPCHNPPAGISWPQPLVVGVCLLFFAAGHFAGYLRDPGSSLRPAMALRFGHIRVAAIVLAALTVFLLLIAALLAYETFALANFDRFWPITFYIRCAAEIAPLPTVGGGLIICFLLGQWLWYPERNR